MTGREVSTHRERHTLYAMAGVCSLSSVSLHFTQETKAQTKRPNSQKWLFSQLGMKPKMEQYKKESDLEQHSEEGAPSRT